MHTPSGPFIVVHGGLETPREADVVTALEGAANAAWQMLTADGVATAAVEEAVRALERSGLFNAGRGSLPNQNGERECDAGIVDGATGRAAGVGGVVGVDEPIAVAAALLREDRGPVLLVGDGAVRFARARDVATAGAPVAVRSGATGHDTVGAIAVDGRGGIAVGSSTGGTRGKLPGRVGDAPVPGAGLFADRDRAVMCTGEGEAALELSLAVRAARFARGAGDATAAAIWGVDLVRAQRDRTMGLVVVDTMSHTLGGAARGGALPGVVRSAEGVEALPVEPRT